MKVLEQSGPAIPRHARRPRRDIVAKSRRYRDRLDRDGAEARGKGRKSAGDLGEQAFLEIDEVHFVDRQHDLPDAEKRADEGVPLGLRQHTPARVDEDHGELGGGRAGRHVARVLLVTRRVGDYKGAFRGGKKAIGDIDSYTLLTLILQSVQQQREIDVFADG